MTERTHVREYIDHFNKRGFGAEEVYKTRALCHIADMLTNIAYDIRELRENADRKEKKSNG